MKTLDEIIASKPPTGRHDSLCRTMEEIHARWGLGPIHIVETGTIRRADDRFRMGDGWATLSWKLWADHTNSRVWTCDLDPHAIETCRRVTGDSDRITYVVGDSVGFLENFPEPINLLYLDSFDTGPPGSPQVALACKHQLREIMAAHDKLTDDALVLLDDIPEDFMNGKGELTLPYLLRRGWKFINVQDTQVLLGR